jgi:hypothetical protein
MRSCTWTAPADRCNMPAATVRVTCTCQCWCQQCMARPWLHDPTMLGNAISLVTPLPLFASSLHHTHPLQVFNCESFLVATAVHQPHHHHAHMARPWLHDPTMPGNATSLARPHPPHCILSPSQTTHIPCRNRHTQSAHHPRTHGRALVARPDHARECHKPCQTPSPALHPLSLTHTALSLSTHPYSLSQLLCTIHTTTMHVRTHGKALVARPDHARECHKPCQTPSPPCILSRAHTLTFLVTTAVHHPP